MYLDRTFAQRIGSAKVKSKSEVTQCIVHIVKWSCCKNICCMWHNIIATLMAMVNNCVEHFTGQHWRRQLWGTGARAPLNFQLVILGITRFTDSDESCARFSVQQSVFWPSVLQTVPQSTTRKKFKRTNTENVQKQRDFCAIFINFWPIFVIFLPTVFLS